MDSTESFPVAKKKDYVHPDFPDRSIERLRKDAEAFNLDDHLVSLLFVEPFYADIIRSLHKERTEKISTAGVAYTNDVMKMWWNPLFLAAYSNEQVRGILKHESLHLALEHTTTRRYKPHLAWNWATDLAINSTLTDAEMPPCGLRPGKKFAIPHDYETWPDDRKALHLKLSALVESLPLNLTGEEYFGLLLENEDFKEMMKGKGGKKGSGKPSGGSGKGGGMEGEGEGGGDGDGGEGEEEDGDGGYPGMDEHEGWDELSDEEREYVAGKIRQAVKDATQKADGKNAWGSCPAGMREEIRKKVNGEIDWRSILRHFVGTTNRADRITSMQRLNRKYPGVQAGTTRDYKPRIHVYMDQSGSVSDSEIELLFGELSCLSSRVEFVLFYFDTEVDEENKFVWKKGSMPKLLRTRCGGTDFEAPTRHAAKSKPEGYLILTDGGAPKPASSRIKRGWVITPGQQLAFDDPDGKDVLIKMKKKVAGSS